MPIKSFYSANDVKPGDVFVVTVKVMVQYNGTYRLYRCPYPDADVGEDGTPQGDLLSNDKVFEVVNHEGGIDAMPALMIAAVTLMPILRIARGPDPTA